MVSGQLGELVEQFWLILDPDTQEHSEVVGERELLELVVHVHRGACVQLGCPVA